MRAGNAEHIRIGGFVIFVDGMSAGMAHVIIALNKTVADTDPLIKYEAVAVPHAVLWVDCFQILENPAFEMKDVLKSLLE